jgi:glucosamine-6-phosphate deaminase
MPTSKVEQLALEKSGRQFQYSPIEKLPVIELENFPALGKLTALRFIEWVQSNPGGVISLPTGKTPEHFIHWVKHYLNNWDDVETAGELESNGVSPSTKPEMASLRFVQIDDFYPIKSTQHNSFFDYVSKYYIDGFGLDRSKALLMDCWEYGTPDGKNAGDVFPDGSVDLKLRERQAESHKEEEQQEVLQHIDQFCTEYEESVRTMGGIGFFLGGIGPDGHIAFNIRGSDHFSTTRLMPTNYETQAAAASDLGGIEVSRSRLIITIGLATITYNPDATAIIIAAGDAKARVVADAIQEDPSNEYPATALHKLPGARFYLTRGAAVRLTERNFENFENSSSLSDEQIRRAVIDLSVSLQKPILDIQPQELEENRFTNLVIEKTDTEVTSILSSVDQHLRSSIERGMAPVENAKILHTAPHHDDIMLAYLPWLIHQVRPASNTHHFAYLTSGFNAVTNNFVLDQLTNLEEHFQTASFQTMWSNGYFKPNNRSAYDRDVYQFLDGIAARSDDLKNEASARRFLRIILGLFEDATDEPQARFHTIREYFKDCYPGQKDGPKYQCLKGMIREFEAELVWGYFGIHLPDVRHLRLGFYKGGLFGEEPEVNRDVLPVFDLLQETDPDFVSVAFDPEGSGPDTHYKVLQAISEALKLHEKKSGRTDIKVWGYRNVWYRYHPSEIDIYDPVSLNSMAIMDDSFNNCFGSQRAASFPSYEYDGPFSHLAQRIQAEQFQMVKTCLGAKFFNEHPVPRLRACHGMCFVKELSLQEFYDCSRELREQME